MQIAGLRYHYADEPWKGMAEQWQRFLSHMGKIPGQVGRTAYGVSFLLPNGVDYLAGVEVSGNSKVPEDFATVSIPAQKYLVFPHREHVSKLHETCRMAGEWLAANGHEAFSLELPGGQTSSSITPRSSIRVREQAAWRSGFRLSRETK